MDYDHFVVDQVDTYEHDPDTNDAPSTAPDRPARPARYAPRSSMSSAQQGPAAPRSGGGAGSASGNRSDSAPDLRPPSATRSALAAIGQAVRGLFRSASEQRIEASSGSAGTADAPSSSAAASAAVNAEAMDIDAAPSTPQRDSTIVPLESRAERDGSNNAGPSSQLAQGGGAHDAPAEQAEARIEVPLSPFAEAIQHAAAVNDEMNRVRGSRPTSPAFGTAQRVSPPPSPAAPNPTASASAPASGPAQPLSDQANASSSSSQTQTGAGSAAAGATAAAAAAATPSHAPASGASGATGAQPPNAGAGAGAQPGQPAVLFRLPFTAADGRQALLIFHPVPLPGIPAHPGPDGAQAGQQPGQPHPHGFVPRNPIFVPAAVSPFNFAILYDAQFGLGWPVAAIEYPATDSASQPQVAPELRPHLIAGPPFQIFFQFTTANGGPPAEEEQPSKEKAEKYVAELERADAELRERMARLGLGDIGDYSEPSSLMDTHGTQGCGICLEPFATEDKPEWVVGKQRAEDEAVVAVPCAGHHTLHASCLRGWLENVKPSAWTCPFCRAPLAVPPSIAGGPSRASGPAGATQATAAQASRSESERSEEKRRLDEAQARSLRDEIRYREKQRGWRCDAAACLPRYPAATEAADGKDEGAEGHGRLSTPATTIAESGEEDPDSEIIKLAPCHHEIHVGCLKTAMRVEADLLTPAAIEEGADDDDDGSDSETDDGEEADGFGAEGEGRTSAALDIPDRKRKRECSDTEGSPSSTHSIGSLSLTGQGTLSGSEHAHSHARRTVGKWVSCPACRSECWAEIPVGPKKRRSTASDADAKHGRQRQRRRRHDDGPAEAA